MTAEQKQLAEIIDNIEKAGREMVFDKSILEKAPRGAGITDLL